MNKIDSFRGEYYFLSNFYEAPVTYNDVTYQNNEAAFQAQKTFGAWLRDKSLHIPSADEIRFFDLNPAQAKHLGRRIELRSDWEYVKVDLMRDIVRAKFTQNKDLRDKLLETGDAQLIEGNTWGDRTWGQVNGSGKNLLGQILMDVRDDFFSARRN